MTCLSATCYPRTINLSITVERITFYYVASQPRTSDRLISHWRALCLLAHKGSSAGCTGFSSDEGSNSGVFLGDSTDGTGERMASWLVDLESAVYSAAFGGLYVSMGWSLMVSDRAWVNFQRNLLFRTVSRLDSLIFTTY